VIKPCRPDRLGERPPILDQEIHRIIEGGVLPYRLSTSTMSPSSAAAASRALAYNLNKVKRKGGAIYIVSSNDYINYIFETLKFNIVFEGYYYKTFEEFSSEVTRWREKPSCDRSRTASFHQLPVFSIAERRGPTMLPPMNPI
jgi:hypothetical protein